MRVDDIKFKPLGAMLIVVALGLAGFTYNSERTSGLLFCATTTVPGVVVERFTSVGDTRQSDPTPKLRVRFSINDKPHVIVRKADESFWNAHDKGASVEVTFPTPTSAASASSKVTTDRARIDGATLAPVYAVAKLVLAAVLFVLGLGVLAYDRWRV